MALGMEVGLGPVHIVLDGNTAPLPKKGAEPPIFGPSLFWPNGWMHQDATCYGGRPQPRRLCVRWGPSPYPKGAEPHPIFVPRLLWPNGCMDKYATWYGGWPRSTRHCVRCGPSYPQKKGHTHPTRFLAHVYCGQMAVWMKTPLGTKVDLGPDHIVLDGIPAPAKGAQQPPLFSPCLLWPNGRPSQQLLSSCCTAHCRVPK